MSTHDGRGWGPATTVRSGARARRRARAITCGVVLLSAASAGIAIAVAVPGGHPTPAAASSAPRAATTTTVSEQRAPKHAKAHPTKHRDHMAPRQRPKHVQPSSAALPKAADLPGYRQQITASDADRLHASVLHVDYGARTGRPDYVNECTGTKVSVRGQAYVLTAAHCLDIRHDQYLAGRPARVVTRRVPMRFAVDLSTSDDAGGPFFPATDIVESQTADAALLRIDASGPDGAQFAAFPALQLEDDLASVVAQGQHTLSSSYEQSASARVDTGGVYLGRATGQNGPWPLAQDDIVGATPAHDDPAADACLFGGSGSLAVLADGRVTGPLSGRDRKGPYAGGVTVAGDWTPRQSRESRRALDAALHVDTRPYGTVCLYSVLTPQLVEEMAALFPAVTGTPGTTGRP